MVTGATGFIGSALFRCLRNEGYPVSGISLNGGVLDGEVIDSVDLRSEASLIKYSEGRSFKAILHLAARIPGSYNAAELERCLFDNMASVQNIVKVASKQQDCHLLYASSVSVYGNNHEIPLSEASLPMPSNYYALSKYMGELLFQLDSNRMPVTVYRISSPYGPGYIRRSVITIFCSQVLRSCDINLFGSGDRSQDFIYIDDIIDAFLLAIKKRRTGVFNLCSGTSTSMHDLAGLVLSLVPASRSRIVFAGRPDPQEHFRGVYSAEKLLRVMGFSAETPIAGGLQKYLRWKTESE